MGSSLLPYSLVCLPLRRGVDRHLLLVFNQVIVEGEIGGVDEGCRGGGGRVEEMEEVPGVRREGYREDGGVFVAASA